MKTHHTPVPWMQDPSNRELICILKDDVYNYLFTTEFHEFGADHTTDTVYANAELIVKAVNNHDELVNALEAILEHSKGRSGHFTKVVNIVENVLQNVKSK